MLMTGAVEFDSVDPTKKNSEFRPDGSPETRDTGICYLNGNTYQSGTQVQINKKSYTCTRSDLGDGYWVPCIEPAQPK